MLLDKEKQWCFPLALLRWDCPNQKSDPRRPMCTQRAEVIPSLDHIDDHGFA